jgi:hypothetical protein
VSRSDARDDERLLRLIDRARDDMALDLGGLTVLTEAASGPFICTALTAARAGAAVVAVTRSSEYGTAADVITRGTRLARLGSVADRITFAEGDALPFADRADIVTNLGFVRPMTRAFVERLPRHAVIALMWEPWEARAGDIDYAACREHGVPVIGTNEHHPRLQTFEYVGVLAIKLLFEEGLEVFGGTIAVVASDPFGAAIERRLRACGATVVRWTPPLEPGLVRSQLQALDAIVLAEHRSPDPLIGDAGGIRPTDLVQAGVRVIHIAGHVDDAAMSRAGLLKRPARRVAPGYMTVTTSYVGAKPVVDLHCAGLRVADVAVRQRHRGGTYSAAIDAAEASGFGLRLPGWT